MSDRASCRRVVLRVEGAHRADHLRRRRGERRPATIRAHQAPVRAVTGRPTLGPRPPRRVELRPQVRQVAAGRLLGAARVRRRHGGQHVAVVGVDPHPEVAAAGRRCCRPWCRPPGRAGGMISSNSGLPVALATAGWKTAVLRRASSSSVVHARVEQRRRASRRGPRPVRRAGGEPGRGHLERSRRTSSRCGDCDLLGGEQQPDAGGERLGELVRCWDGRRSCRR